MYPPAYSPSPVERMLTICSCYYTHGALIFNKRLVHLPTYSPAQHLDCELFLLLTANIFDSDGEPLSGTLNRENILACLNYRFPATNICLARTFGMVPIFYGMGKRIKMGVSGGIESLVGSPTHVVQLELMAYSFALPAQSPFARSTIVRYPNRFVQHKWDEARDNTHL